ncbi:FxSxx-COOH system tetratricopeptide repeat protein [Embleya sp. NPDC050154]|uniref:FxSxx-COOH system tetratricopeptide repeat protein n=1 Tax=Embleya sp. NPDC050154 TaxID=3363988 RepID=UPI0037B6B76E
MGANAAGRDVIDSVAVFAERAVPPEAYAPIPADAPGAGVSNIPRTGLFVGRGDELAALEEAFAVPGEVVVHAVHGLGGVGKSALAAQWAAQRPERMRWWIVADTTTGADGAAAVDAGLAALARTLQPGLAELPAEMQVTRATRWLTEHEGWLLVLDNVEDPAHVRPLLDRIPGGRVLITTRRATGWHRDATTLRLGTLEPDESLDLFTRVVTHDAPQHAEGAEAVCAELGHLALAIEQAAAFCARTGTAPTAYLDMLAKWPAAVFAAAERGAPERAVARVWRVTLDRLADTPLAGDILRVLAWYAPDDIPRDVLDPMATPPETATAIGELVAFSMITDNRDGTLSVHRLVQHLARTPDHDRADPHRLPEHVDHALNRATALLATAFPNDITHPDAWPRCRTLLPHVDALTDRHTPDHDTPHTARALDCAATFRDAQGAHRLVVPALERALVARQESLGNDHPHTLASRNNLAGAYESAGDLGKAIPLYELALTDCERVLGNDHPHTLTARNNLAYAYLAGGDLDQAIPLYELTVADCERVLGNNHPSTLTARNNLAYAYRTLGDLGQAIPLYELTVADSERVLSNNHPDTLTARNNLAGSYHSAGDLERAIPLFQRALAERERVLGDDHPDTLSSRNNLAAAYQEVGDLKQAIPLFQSALAGCERVLGNDHPHTLATRNNLAGAYESAGDLGKAIPQYELTLADSQRVLGDNHPHTLTTRNNLAYAYQAAGDLEQAIPLYELTLADSQRVLSNNHPHTLTIRTNLDGAYMEVGDAEQAIPQYQRTLTDRERVLPPDIR